ncbi:hypothetical protein V6N13_108707 [Hibiscus sabdariffa]
MSESRSQASCIHSSTFSRLRDCDIQSLLVGVSKEDVRAIVFGMEPLKALDINGLRGMTLVKYGDQIATGFAVAHTCRELLSRQWNMVVRHINRCRNSVAGKLAGFGVSLLVK